MHISRCRHMLLAIALGGALGLTGCATTGPKALSPEAQSEEGKKPAAAVEDIKIDDGRIILAVSGKSATYTAFKTTGPDALIIELAGAPVKGIAPEISAENEFFNGITIGSSGEEAEKRSRITVSLNPGVEHEIRQEENRLIVSFSKQAPKSEPEKADDKSLIEAAASLEAQKAVVATAPAPAATAPAELKPPAEGQKAAVAEGQVSEAGARKSPEIAEAAPKPAPPQTVKAAEPAKNTVAEPTNPARRILNIEPASDGYNTFIKVTTDGAVSKLNSFMLDSPSRIVVDIWGIDKDGVNARKVNSRNVKSVRLGHHNGKARVVVDVSGKGELYAVDNSAGVVTITVGPKAAGVHKEKPAGRQGANTQYGPKAMETGSGHVKEGVLPKQARTAQPAEPLTEKTEAKVLSARIEKVELKRLDEKVRLTVARSSKTPYAATESKDGKALYIDIKDAVIPDELSRIMDATKLKTQVYSVSSYQETPTDVRITVRTTDRVPYEIKEENGVLTVDFAARPVVEGQKQAEGRRGYTGKKIDLDMIDANVSDVLRLLAEISDLNIIASDEVRGNISLRLKEVPWDQAFDIILKAKDLDSIREGNVIRVAPAAKIRQEKESALASSKAQEKLEDLDTRFIPVSYAAVDELLPHVKAVLSDRGSVTSEKRTSTLIVRDIKRGLDAATGLVTRLDKTTPQVLIEARIVEASSSFARDLGIQWGVDYQMGGENKYNLFGGTSQAGSTLPTHSNPPFSTREGVTSYAVNMPATGTAGALGALGFAFGKTGSNPLILDLKLSAGESEGKLKTISRPRVTTIDNKEAKIEQGESVPFETTSAAGTATTFIDANLSLTVTPHITPDGSVLMKIKASRNSIGTFRTSSGQPSINKKESTTEVLVKDGETTVIGGIVISDKNESDRGIPFLKDLPVLGWLFKSKSVSDTQTELLIFITPSIIKDMERIKG